MAAEANGKLADGAPAPWMLSCVPDGAFWLAAPCVGAVGGWKRRLRTGACMELCPCVHAAGQTLGGINMPHAAQVNKPATEISTFLEPLYAPHLAP